MQKDILLNLILREIRINMYVETILKKVSKVEIEIKNLS